MIKKAFLPALVLAAASVAVPTMAQSYGQTRQHSGFTISIGSSPGYGYNSGYNSRYNSRYNSGYNSGYDQSGWQAINRRQANLDRRIDVGIRNGQLTRREAISLRREFSNIARLESRYRRNGLTRWEMADLDRRFDRLSAQIRYERRDRETRYDRNGRNDRYDRNYRNGRYN